VGPTGYREGDSLGARHKGLSNTKAAVDAVHPYEE